MDSKQKCSKCEKEFQYNENQDKTNNELIPMKIRKVVIDKNNQMFPLYSMPKDKQRLVNEKMIQMICSSCYKPA